MGVRSMAQDMVGSETGPQPNSEAQQTVERASLTNERSGQSLVDQGIGIMVAVIVIGAVAIPVVQDVVASINTTEMGMAGNILEYVTLALALGLFVAAISIVR